MLRSEHHHPTLQYKNNRVATSGYLDVMSKYKCRKFQWRRQFKPGSAQQTADGTGNHSHYRKGSHYRPAFHEWESGIGTSGRCCRMIVSRKFRFFHYSQAVLVSAFKPGFYPRGRLWLNSILPGQGWCVEACHDVLFIWWYKGEGAWFVEVPTVEQGFKDFSKGKRRNIWT